jgi:hypothetical protein
MKKWILKAVIQKGISFLPFKHQINFLFQKYITRGVQLSDHYFTDKLIHHRKHEQFYIEQQGRKLDNIEVLELGTGWYPVVPIAQFLCGARKIYSVDISPLMNYERVKQTVDQFVAYHQSGKLAPYLQNLLPERLKKLEQLSINPPGTFEALLQALGLEYLVADARSLPLEKDSIDFITSNNVFEHIYPNILKDILKDFQRVLKTDGLMSHFIDMSDHFAHLDDTINIYHFLRFSEQQWHWIDNSIQPQNRMRIPQYRALYQQSGIDILHQEHRPGSLQQVEATPLSAPFNNMPVEEVAISHSYVVSRG